MRADGEKTWPMIGANGERWLGTTVVNGDSSASVQSGSPTLSAFELLAVLWRRKLIVTSVCVLSIAAALGLSLRSPKQYSSSAELLFREPGFAQALFGSGLYQTSSEEPQRTTQTNIDIVLSRNVAAVAANALHIRESPEDLLRSIAVTPSSNANIAIIKATRTSPGEAAKVANAFAEAYISYQRETDRRLVVQAEELVNSSLQTASLAERPKLESSLRQLRVLRALQTGNGQVIAPGQPDATAVSPRPGRDALFGGVVGLLLGCGLALVVDFLDRRLKTAEDIEQAYGYQLIASIPRVGSERGKDGDVRRVASAAYGLDGPTGEAYRMLRESLRFVDPTGRARCFVVTSADEGEGKSTVSVNLALALDAIERRVVLVEADMRKPTAAAQLGVAPTQRGLSDVLVSDSAVEESLVEAQEAIALRVLPSGTTPPNSADLLSAARMMDVIAAVRDAADVVIIDSPPLLPVADTHALMQVPGVDGVIVVAQARTSRRDRIRVAKRILEQSGRKVYGLVVTGAPPATDSRYSYYHHDHKDTSSRSRRQVADVNLSRPRERRS